MNIVWLAYLGPFLSTVTPSQVDGQSGEGKDSEMNGDSSKQEDSKGAPKESGSKEEGSKSEDPKESGASKKGDKSKSEPEKIEKPLTADEAEAEFFKMLEFYFGDSNYSWDRFLQDKASGTASLAHSVVVAVSAKAWPCWMARPASPSYDGLVEASSVARPCRYSASREVRPWLWPGGFERFVGHLVIASPRR